MTDPLFGASFFVGILGNFLARHVDPISNPAAAAIFERLSNGSTELPPNHDVERACRTALRQALELMAQTMDLQIAQPKTLVEAFQNRFDASGKWKPMIEWWQTEEMEWFEELTESIASEKTLGKFDLRWIKGASSLNDSIRSLNDPTLEKQFADELLEWTDSQQTRGKRPVFFEEWARKGWPVAKESPHVRISLYAAWCLFLQHHFKDDQKVRAILTADWLASIDERLKAVSINSKDISAALQEPLGEQLKILIDVRDQVQALAESHSNLHDRSSQLLAIVLEFRNDVGGEFLALRTLLAETHAVVQRTHDTVHRTHEVAVQTQTQVTATDIVVRSNDRKLDQILELLNQCLSDNAQLPDSTRGQTRSTALSKPIADSKLLASDGAARYKKLVGRSQEKGLLTRSWRGGQLRVLSFVAWGGSGKTSLVTDWLVDHVGHHWDGVDAFFDWSFYSQGTKDHSNASSDTFLRAALLHFGERDTADSAKLAEEKASVLADAMAKQRTLLVLDGLEPLQHPRKRGQDGGRLKDNGIATLLRLLAQAKEHVLCVITTRLSVVDLRPFHDTTVHEVSLNQLSIRHGAELLHLAGAKFAGDAEIEDDDPELVATARQMKGHAMTLQMLGGYLRSVHDGDIRQRDRVDFQRAFEDQSEGHTYNVMAAYEEWFQADGQRGHRQLAVLRMMGLFDRVADAGCIDALRKDGGIPRISDGVAGISNADWRDTLTHLSDHGLVFRDRKTHSLDAHPLIREYFATQLKRDQPEAFQAAHSRLFDYLCQNTPYRPDTLDGLAPLYQAVIHGCLAGRQHEACEKVYDDRILRGTGVDGFYSTNKLGAIGADLAAVAAFFDEPWSLVSQNLAADAQAWLLSEAGFRLRAIGRLNEALPPMRAGLEMTVQQQDWKPAAACASNLSELEVTLGRLPDAVTDARQSVTHADQSSVWDQRMISRTAAADALCQSGHRAEAGALFAEAERLQQEGQPQFDLLYSLQGFRYCDWLLPPAEQVAWRHLLQQTISNSKSQIAVCLSDVECRASTTFSWMSNDPNAPILTVALDRLTLARVGLFRAILESGPRSGTGSGIHENTDSLEAHRADDSGGVHSRLSQYKPDARASDSLWNGKGQQAAAVHATLDLSHVNAAVNGLRSAGEMMYLPLGLLTAALYHFVCGEPAVAEKHLAEAQQIAERGPMPLFLADIHLTRARLFRDRDELDKAARLIRDLGYGRRYDELADAEEAAKSW